MKSYEFIDVTIDGPIMEITLNRPEAYNALHGPAHRELDEAFNKLENNKDLWVGIITGAGEKAFCSGNDLKATQKGGDISTPKSGFGGISSRYDREKPVIAAVNGIAMGGGMEIAMACDIIIAAPNALFALPEVKVGLFAAAGGVQRLSRQIGRKKAMELILTGDHFGADKALEYGIINHVSEKTGSGVMDDARALANKLLLSSPSAVKTTKRVLNELDALERMNESISASGEHMMKLMTTNDAKEGVLAFVEKRPPNWTNS